MAVDHSDGTLTRYLAHVPRPYRTIDLIRRDLAIAAIGSGADSVVIALNDLEWARARLSDFGFVIGLPDFDSSNLSQEELGRTLNTVPANSTFPIKLGFDIRDGNADIAASVLGDFLHSCGSMMFILEPYFSADFDTGRRASFLHALSKCPCVSAFKLDVEAPNELADIYSESVGTIPWFARSDGLDYETFVSRTKLAVARGCTGVIAGAAIWLSEIESFALNEDLERSALLIRQRVSVLRQICLK